MRGRHLPGCRDVHVNVVGTGFLRVPRFVRSGRLVGAGFIRAGLVGTGLVGAGLVGVGLFGRDVRGRVRHHLRQRHDSTGTSSGVVNSSLAGSSSGVLTQTPAPLVRAMCSFTNPQVFFELPPGAPPGATYSCRLNNGAPSTCMSPLDVTGLNVHQEATVEVVAQLPGLTASPAVTRMVRRGFSARRGR